MPSELTATQKIARLKPLLEHALRQRGKGSRDNDFLVWFSDALDVLNSIFGYGSKQSDAVTKLDFRYIGAKSGVHVNYDEQKIRDKAFYDRDVELAVGALKRFIAELELEVEESSRELQHPLANLHPTIQQAASKLFADGHYRQALLDAYIAVDNAVREKSQLAGSGTRLMETAFSPGNPVLKIGDSPDEQQGFMALFRGAILAIRNPKAHSLNGTHDAQRALEWLFFASVLLRNLDESALIQPTAIPPVP
jgi:uncharacterized protein (TIGR02391 family)